MIELLQIILSFFIFFLMITVPINIFNSELFIKKNFFSLDLASFNLLLNCNILLLLSFLPISLSSYNLFFIFLYIFIFIYIYFIHNYKFNLYKNFIQFLSILIVIFLIISINVAGELNLGWDAKYFWYIKALFFIENQNFYDLNKFIYIGNVEINAFHPHLGSYFWAFFWNLAPIKFEYFGRLFYVFLFCFSIFYVCHNNLRDKFLSNIIFILIILIFYTYDKFSGLQEILIFSILVLLSKYFFLLENSKKKYYVFFIILGCNLIIWFKSEGIAYSAILVLLLNFSRQVSNKTKVYANIFYLSIVVLKVIIYKSSNIPLNAQPYYFEYISNLDFEFIIYKLKFIIPYFFYYALTNVLFVSGIIILFMFNFQKKNYSYIKLLNYYFILNLIFIFSAYLFRDMEIEHSVRVTLGRIIFTSSAFYVFLIVNFFKKLNRNF